MKVTKKPLFQRFLDGVEVAGNMERAADFLALYEKPGRVLPWMQDLWETGAVFEFYAVAQNFILHEDFDQFATEIDGVFRP